MLSENVPSFSFQLVSIVDVKKVIQDLKNNKSVGREIPIQILKECEFTFEVLAFRCLVVTKGHTYLNKQAFSCRFI